MAKIAKVTVKIGKGRNAYEANINAADYDEAVHGKILKEWPANRPDEEPEVEVEELGELGNEE